jgi:dihydroneopterin triphosphate diphosphatase
MQGPVSSSIEVCVFRIEKGIPSYLLLRRAPAEKLYPGVWQFVTGSVRSGENGVEAGFRELREETGLVPEAFWVAPHVNSFYDPEAHVIVLSPLFAARVASGVSPRLSAEHSEMEWVSRKEAARKLVWPGQLTGLRIVHQYIVGGREAAKLTRIQ